ncbi:glycoside hydrolase family 88 protein [Catenovulum sp. 2E275]|uniref:glycoside hydrolase family 88/105 protein n=1 Tax=Catenovulum sp. 2E275 TaxID=2980497 RepID=UPI0021D2ED68|nr:glycoside hydrolase family 88 protein [Catenovulum sp. 2E275]MCU4676559.1 glycoside hydrolase family 88 protein [Catenovulum sp. 2E275]
MMLKLTFKLTILFILILHKNATAGTLGEDTSNAIITRYQPTIDALTHHGWDHSNSVIMHGMEKIFHNTGNQTYFKYIQAYADSYILADGSINGLLNTLDGIHPGIICLFLYRQTGQQKYLQAAKNMRDHLLSENSAFNKTPDGAYWHKNVDKYKNVASVDGLYMAYPFLIRYGLLAQDQIAINKSVEQILLVSERSFNIKYKLPLHAWNYDKEKPWAHPITGTATQFWGRASAWYAMALVDILEVLPPSHSAYPKIKILFSELAEGIRATQNPNTGFWHQVLDKHTDPANYPESSATGMIVYALQKGINLGLLDHAYTVTTLKGWQALKTAISTAEDGQIQINGFAPGMSPQNTYQDYLNKRPVSVPTIGDKQYAHGYMAVLMAASVMEKP